VKWTIRIATILCVTLIFSACITPPKSPEPPSPSVPSLPLPPPQSSQSLSWEAGHDERKAWSKALLGIIEKDLEIYLLASDLPIICPKIKSLEKEKQIRAIAEFWIATIYHESGFDPRSQSVDVGSKDKRSTWSIGLTQISEIDQEWVSLDRRYSYDELLTPEPNMKLANAIMVRQINRNKKILLDNSSKDRYWAVLLVGNKYSEIKNIIERVQNKTGFCL